MAGDESMLLRLRQYVDYAQTWEDTYVLVAQVGSALVVLADNGWEEGSGHESLVRDLSAAAVLTGSGGRAGLGYPDLRGES